MNKVAVIGSGPIVIGQSAEFDYSGTQCLKALREEGVKTVLINSNPATIMTDPDMSDKVYIEPITPYYVKKVLEKEMPDGLIATMGGQTGLNVSLELAESGVLDELGIKLLGTSVGAIRKAEDREEFRELMNEIHEPIPLSETVTNVENAVQFAKDTNYPVIVRPAYTLGGTGGGIARNEEELRAIAANGIRASRINQVLLEESLLGWGEFEYEVMRDASNTTVIVCSMENIDPMGVHTGESVVVAPVQTLSDEDNQALRNSALKIIRALGIEGGCNVQFALNYETGDYRVIEVNPRVSRSSALASKATGYPIARVAAKIALGKRLHEIPNSITQKTPAAFEPTLDYVITKIPKWPFEKFKRIDRTIGTQMKSTGEVMAIGRTFEESFSKALASLEMKPVEFDEELLKFPNDMRIHALFNSGKSVEELHALTGINKWFLEKLARVKSVPAKSFKIVDTCAAEFDAVTPYYYSTADEENESEPLGNSVVVLGSGANRIGQGVEFDYSCVHAALAIREQGLKSIMVNCNPETVSTDYDVSDKLFFEPLTLEHVLNICKHEQPRGVIVQFGGQTSLNLAKGIEDAGFKVLGTSSQAIDDADDREKFTQLLNRLDIPQPEYGTAFSAEEALRVAKRIGYPVIVRPSYVIGGRAMQVVYSDEDLEEYMEEAVKVSPEHPVLVDRFLQGAKEAEVDAVCDGEDVIIGEVMEHIELAGIHSGDSSCVLPPQTLSEKEVETIRDYTRKIALESGTVGLINVQFVINNKVYVIEANPRASRTVPFVAKSTGLALAKLATKVILGKKLKELGAEEKKAEFVCVKRPVFPFLKISGSDPLLGPEMKSTGEVMGRADTYHAAFYKALVASGVEFPAQGSAILSVCGEDKPLIVNFARRLCNLGYKLFATPGTHAFLGAEGVESSVVEKVSDGNPNIVDLIRGGSVAFVVNSLSSAKQSFEDAFAIRRAAIENSVFLASSMQEVVVLGEMLNKPFSSEVAPL